MDVDARGVSAPPPRLVAMRGWCPGRGWWRRWVLQVGLDIAVLCPAVAEHWPKVAGG